MATLPPKLFDHPLVIWVGTATASFSEGERDQLRRFLRSGGTSFIDDASDRVKTTSTAAYVAR